MAEIKTLRKVDAATLDPEQAAFVAVLRNLVDRALAGEIVCLFAIVCAHEDDEHYHEPVLAGLTMDVSDLFRRCDHLKDMVDELDGTSWIIPDEDDDE